MTVTPAGGVAAVHVVAPIASPAVWSRPLVFAGLGRATSATVRIEWPSGLEQEVGPLAAGKLHHIDEPAPITFDPPTRRAAANGSSQVRVAATGTLALRLVAGTGTLVKTAGGYDVVAPATPGFALLEVTLDGRVLGVTPRIEWE